LWRCRDSLNLELWSLNLEPVDTHGSTRGEKSLIFQSVTFQRESRRSGPAGSKYAPLSCHPAQRKGTRRCRPGKKLRQSAQLRDTPSSASHLVRFRSLFLTVLKCHYGTSTRSGVIRFPTPCSRQASQGHPESTLKSRTDTPAKFLPRTSPHFSEISAKAGVALPRQHKYRFHRQPINWFSR